VYLPDTPCIGFQSFGQALTDYQMQKARRDPFLAEPSEDIMATNKALVNSLSENLLAMRITKLEYTIGRTMTKNNKATKQRRTFRMPSRPSRRTSRLGAWA